MSTRSHVSHSMRTNGTYYPYNASIGASVVFVVAFAVLLAILIWDYIRFRRKRHNFAYSDIQQGGYALKVTKKEVSVSLIPIGLGLFFESLGYIMRIFSITNHNYSRTLYIIPQCFTLVAPSLIAAGVFMVFNRIEKMLNAEKFSIVPNKFLTAFFVTGDVVSFLIQGMGGSLMIRDNLRRLGLRLALVGFALQIFFFLFFLVVASVWHWRINRDPTKVALLMDVNDIGVRYYQWRRFSLAMIVSMVMILVRCILRIAEFGDGLSGNTSFATSELAYYLIDPFVIFWSCFVLVVMRPEYRLWDIKVFQESDSSEERRGSVGTDNIVETGSVLLGESKLVGI